jgi:glutaredoxin-like YruB-family protein
MKVKIYTTPTCPWCKKVKAFLKENKVDYSEVDVSVSDAASREMVKKSGQMSVPVTEIDGVIITGFDEAKLRSALKL